MDACASIQQQAVDFAIDKNKTSTFTIIKALYPSLKAKHPNLHSLWLQSACRSGAAVVHSFKNRKRKGQQDNRQQDNRIKDKRQGMANFQKPKIKRPFVYVSKQILKWDNRTTDNRTTVGWDKSKLTLTFKVSPNDKEPVVLNFRPHHRYCRLLDDWKAGRAVMGEPTLTFNSIFIPLKFPEVKPYKPKRVIGIDSNELNLTAYEATSALISTLCSSSYPCYGLKSIVDGTKGERQRFRQCACGGAVRVIQSDPRPERLHCWAQV